MLYFSYSFGWYHPNLPWDDTELWLAEIGDDGQVGQAQRIAGGPKESIFQPEWSPDGTLYFISDRTGWWDLYRWPQGMISPVVQMEAEFGVPLWQFRASTYAFASASRIICTYSQAGISHLASIDTASGKLEVIEMPYTDIGSIQAGTEQVVFLAASPTEFASVVQMDLSSYTIQIVRRASAAELDPSFVSVGEPIEFPTESNLMAYGFSIRRSMRNSPRHQKRGRRFW